MSDQSRVSFSTLVAHQIEIRAIKTVFNVLEIIVQKQVVYRIKSLAGSVVLFSCFLSTEWVADGASTRLAIEGEVKA